MPVGVFAKHRLHLGGPLATSHLHALHGCAGIDDSFEILEGLYSGGMTDAAEKFLRGELSLQEFK